MIDAISRVIPSPLSAPHLRRVFFVLWGGTPDSGTHVGLTALAISRKTPPWRQWWPNQTKRRHGPDMQRHFILIGVMGLLAAGLSVAAAPARAQSAPPGATVADRNFRIKRLPYSHSRRAIVSGARHA